MNVLGVCIREPVRVGSGWCLGCYSDMEREGPLGCGGAEVWREEPAFTSGQRDGFLPMNFPAATWALCSSPRS